MLHDQNIIVVKSLLKMTYYLLQGKFGFLEIDEKEDADDAIRDLSGKSFNGGRLVESTIQLMCTFLHIGQVDC